MTMPLAISCYLINKSLFFTTLCPSLQFNATLMDFQLPASDSFLHLSQAMFVFQFRSISLKLIIRYFYLSLVWQNFTLKSRFINIFRNFLHQRPWLNFQKPVPLPGSSHKVSAFGWLEYRGLTEDPAKADLTRNVRQVLLLNMTP